MQSAIQTIPSAIPRYHSVNAGNQQTSTTSVLFTTTTTTHCTNTIPTHVNGQRNASISGSLPRDRPTYLPL